MGKQIIDQLAHFIVAIVILLLPLILPWGFVISGFLIGFVREQGQELEVNGETVAWKIWKWGKGRWLDIAFWTLGGLAAELIFRAMCAC